MARLVSPLKKENFKINETILTLITFTNLSAGNEKSPGIPEKLLVSCMRNANSGYLWKPLVHKKEEEEGKRHKKRPCLLKPIGASQIYNSKFIYQGKKRMRMNNLNFQLKKLRKKTPMNKEEGRGGRG